jgi:uncharacterized protein (TIGR03435 family)
MLQKLIAERLGLKFHRKQQEMPGYGLVNEKKGPKLKPSTDNPVPVRGRDGFADVPKGVAPGVIQIDSVGSVRRLAAGAMSMAQLADYLAGQSDLPVVDLTELHGKFDIVLYYSRPVQTATNSAAPADNGLDLPSALREQLGLELQTRKMRLDMLVIDHIEQTPLPS